MRIVRRGHAAARNLPFPTPSRHGLRRRRLATTAIAQVIRTAAARTSRRSVRSRLTTTIAAIRHSAPTIRPRARTQSREHIPHRAAAIQLRPDPTPHRRIPPPAAVIAAVEGASAPTSVGGGAILAAGGGGGAALIAGGGGGLSYKALDGSVYPPRARDLLPQPH